MPYQQQYTALARCRSLRKLALVCIVAAIAAGSAQAMNLGISYSSASGEMPVAFRTAIKDLAGETGRINARVTDAQNDSLREMEGIENFIATRVDAMIVAPVDRTSTQKITRMANRAGIPLVLLDASFDEKSSRRGVSTVGSGDKRPGVVQMREVCRLMGGAGNVVVLTGDPAQSSTRERMQEIEEVVSQLPCQRIKIIDWRQGGANPLQSAEAVSAWFKRGSRIGAVLAQSDELALGAIHALKKAQPAGHVIVAGIGATPAGLAAVDAGDMTLTVFLNEAEQGRAALDLALRMADGTIAQSTDLVPASVVTKSNCASYRQALSRSDVPGRP